MLTLTIRKLSHALLLVAILMGMSVVPQLQPKAEAVAGTEGWIMGKVLKPDNTPLANARVDLAWNPTGLQGSFEDVRVTTSDAEGNYRFDFICSTHATTYYLHVFLDDGDYRYHTMEPYPQVVIQAPTNCNKLVDLHPTKETLR